MKEEILRVYLSEFPGGQNSTLQDILPIGTLAESYGEATETTKCPVY